MRSDPAPVEVARYALAPPLVELPLVLGELAGIAGVVEETRGLQLLDSVVDCVRRHPLAFEARAQLRDRELTAGDRLIGQVDRPLALGPPHGSRGPSRALSRLLLGNRGLGSGRRIGLRARVALRSDRRLHHAKRPSRIHPERLVDLALDLLSHLRVLAQETLGVVAPLTQPVVPVGEERTGLLHDVVLDPEVEDAALRADALAILDVELGLAERGGDLVPDHLHAHPVADRLGALLEGLDAADVEALRGIELERPPARLRLRGTEHYPHLLADLVREDAERVGAVQVAGQLPHR